MLISENFNSILTKSTGQLSAQIYYQNEDPDTESVPPTPPTPGLPPDPPGDPGPPLPEPAPFPDDDG